MASETLSIKIPKLNDQNYMTWQRMAKALLVEKEHWEAMLQPTASSAAVSTTVNDKANSFLVLHVEESLLHLVDDNKPAWQNWKALQSTFASAATARKISLTRDLHGLRMSDEESIADFFGRAQQLRLQLRLVGETITDQQLTVNILAGLPRAYDTVMEVLQDSTKPIHELQARLQLTEARLRRTQLKPPATGYGAQGAPQRGTPPPGKKWCDKHKWGYHTTQDCRSLGNGRKHAGGGHGHRGGHQPANEQDCMLCNKQGHFARDCPDLMDFHKFQAESHGCVGHMATAGHPDAAKPFITSFDPEDWMLEEALFKELDQEYGPCTVDGCAAPDGSNNQVARYYSKAQDFLAADVRGECVWLNPPFRRAGQFINHLLENWRRAPTTTSGLILVPLVKTASWYPAVEQLPLVRSWPAGTQLFTKPTGEPGGNRRALRPCHFPVAVYFLPRRAVPLPRLHNPTWPFAAADGLQTTEPDCTAEHIVLDSGASHFMTPERKMLKDYQEGPGDGPSFIQVANKSTIPVLGRGIMQLNTWVKGQQHTVELKNVLHAPDLSLTLLSIPALMDVNAEVQFARNQCIVSFDGQPKMIAVQPRRKPGAAGAPNKLFHVLAVEPSFTGSTAHVAQGNNIIEVTDFKLGDTDMGCTAPCDLTKDTSLAAFPDAAGDDQLNGGADFHTGEGLHSDDAQDGGDQLECTTPQHAPGHHPPATSPPTAPAPAPAPPPQHLQHHQHLLQPKLLHPLLLLLLSLLPLLLLPLPSLGPVTEATLEFHHHYNPSTNLPVLHCFDRHEPVTLKQWQGHSGLSSTAAPQQHTQQQHHNSTATHQHSTAQSTMHIAVRHHFLRGMW